jgi:hypothetical protein
MAFCLGDKVIVSFIWLYRLILRQWLQALSAANFIADVEVDKGEHINKRLDCSMVKLLDNRTLCALFADNIGRKEHSTCCTRILNTRTPGSRPRNAGKWFS